MKSTILAGAALALSGIALSACGQGGSQSAQEAAPESMPGVIVADGRLVLPAVKGNPGAVYFDVTYDGDDAAMIRAAEVQGAKSAMMHSTVKDAAGNASMEEVLQVQLEKGKTLKFEPGGNHVMAMDLDKALKPGDTTEVTLTFVGGDKVSFPATVLAAGDAR